MTARHLGLSLAALSCASAQDSQITADQLRNLLQDSNGELAKIAQNFSGNKGGNQLFYFPTRDEPTTPAAWGFKY